MIEATKWGHVCAQLNPHTDHVELPVGWTLLTTWNAVEGTSCEWLQLVGGDKWLIYDGPPPAEHHCNHLVSRAFIDGQPFIDWIIDHYDRLPAFLVTGHFPFDHNPNWLAMLREAVAAQRPYTDLCEPTYQAIRNFFDDGREYRPLNETQVEVSNWEPRCLKFVWHNLFRSPMPTAFSHAPAHYFSVVRSDMIRQRSKAFWLRVKAIADLACSEYRVTCYTSHPQLSWDPGYALEALWRHLFDPTLETWV